MFIKEFSSDYYMNGIKKMIAIFVLVLLVLNIPVIYAQDLVTTASILKMDQVGNNTFEISLSIIKMPSKGTIEAQRERQKEAQDKFLAGNVEDAKEDAFEWIDEYKQQTEFIKDAKIQVEYFGVNGWTSTGLPGEGGEGIVITSEERQKIDPETGAVLGVMYYNNITIPPAVLQQGDCAKLQAYLLESPVDIPRPEKTDTELCDLKLADIELFSNRLNELIMEEIGNNYLLCFGTFILFGLLLSTLYFTGKSPITLLDVATPRLPSPKGLAAGGQILGAFGYTEMKMATKKKMAAAAKVFGKESAILAGTAGVATVVGIDRLASKIKGSFADKHAGDVGQHKEFFKSLAHLANKAGIKPREIARLAKHMNQYTKEDYELLGKVLNTIDKKLGGDKHAMLLNNLFREYVEGALQFQRLEVVTGAPEAGVRGSTHQWAATAVGKHLGLGVNRYMLLGPFVSGALDSMYRTARFGNRFMKATTATAARTVLGKGGMAALSERAKEDKVAAAAHGFLSTASPTTVVLGSFFPINDKMASLYQNLTKEMYANGQVYVLGELFAHYKIRLAMREEQLMEMMTKDTDVLAMAGLDKLRGSQLREFEALELKIKGIFSDTSLGGQEKLQKLMDMASMYGVSLDKTALMGMMSKIDSINALGSDSDYGHIKLMELYQYLAEEHGINNPAYKSPESGFSLTMGRDAIDPNKMWEYHNLRTYVDQYEHGYLAGGIKEILKGSYLSFMNRATSLMADPSRIDEYMKQFPEFARQGDYHAINKRMNGYLGDLMTAEGRAEFARLHDGKSVDNATLAEKADMLYSMKYMEKKYGKEFEHGMMMREKGGAMQWWEEGKELGPHREWFKIDMKKDWHLEPHEDLSNVMWARNRVTERSGVSYHNPKMERELDGYAEAKSWSPEQRGAMATKLLARDLMQKELGNHLKSMMGPDAYTTTNNAVQHYTKTAAAFMAAALKEQGFAENHPDIKKLEQFDSNSHPGALKDVVKIMKSYDKEYKEYISKPVTMETITKSPQAMVMMHEGGFAPYIHGMNLSDYDRVLGGYVSVKDAKGQYRRFDPDSQSVDFGDNTKLDTAFRTLYNGSVKDSREWQGMLQEAKEWAGNDYGRQKVFASALWKYSMLTDDWKGFWKDTNVTIRPKHETAPLAPNMVRFFTGKDLPTEYLSGLRNKALEFGHGISSVGIATAGPLLEASYGITPFSERYKQRSWVNAAAIKNADMDKVLKDVSVTEREMLKKYYEGVASEHGAYNNVWAFAIDRNPQRASTSYGARQAWGSFFHYGPRDPYSFDVNTRGYMNAGEYANFTAHTWPSRLARTAVKPFTAVFRGAQQAMQGYPSKWDYTGSPLRPWNYTQPRLQEFFQSFNAFAAVRGKDVWQGSLAQRDLAGKRISTGLSQSPHEIEHVRSGVYACARTGAANPGSSYYDYRYTLQLDPAMAEYLVYRGGTQGAGTRQSPGEAARAYYAADNYVRDQALKRTVKREVSGVALTMERERETRGFGFWANPIMAFSSPLMAAWHGTGVFGASWGSPKEWATQGVQRVRQGGYGKQLVGMGSEYQQKGKETARKFVRPDQAHRAVYCGKCGTAGQRGHSCIRCSSPLY